MQVRNELTKPGSKGLGLADVPTETNILRLVGVFGSNEDLT
jgi:hypothetical protein